MIGVFNAGEAAARYQERYRQLRGEIARVSSELELAIASLLALEQELEGSDVPARIQLNQLRWRDSLIQLHRDHLAALQKEEAEIREFWEWYISESAQVQIKAEALEATRQKLLQRRCHFQFCTRHIGSDDETETYCQSHRDSMVRERIKRQREDIEEELEAQEQRRREPPPHNAGIWARRTVSLSDDPQLLADRIAEVDSIPTITPAVFLEDDIKRRSDQLVSWNYSVFKRHHSRRYEGFRAVSR